MERMIMTVVLIAFSTAGLFAQTTKSADSNGLDPKEFRVEPEKPDVFIKYEKTTSYTNSRGEHYDVYWLRIHNNLKGDISFKTYDESISPSGKPGIHYEIEDASCESCFKPLPRLKREVPSGFPPGDISEYSRLKAGGTYLFGVPEFHLLEETRLKILFNYPWEVGREYEDIDRPFHFVYFFANDLPKKGRQVD